MSHKSINKRQRLKRRRHRDLRKPPPATVEQSFDLAIPQTSADASICRPGSWFSDGFDESAKSFINDHQWPDASNRCYLESARWADLLVKNGFDAKIVIGWYKSFFHTWVEVKGKIFDCTFSQFEETPSHHKYKTELAVGRWEDMVELAFSLIPAFLYFPESTKVTVRFSWPEKETNSASGSTTENQQDLLREFANDVRRLEAFRGDNPGAAVSDALQEIQHT